ncbi:hypothetical protein A4D02_14540 [Niastella koreensis]|uniref:Methyltransferase type 12 n=1 Tax=Niastella koreensis TaxID=354356 RepID=A0ABX3NRM6_9BACT|nr:hypothetical protein A4D02_14540 [Niastella koreensis]
MYRITRRNFYKLLGRLNIYLQPRQQFSIKAGYHHATRAENFDDTSGRTNEWQRSVYELAATLAQKHNMASVLDVGCGSAYKLITMFSQYQLTGIETEPAYSFLNKKYPGHKWLLFDNVKPAELHHDLVICSDVIEHIKNPDEMMNFLAAVNFRYLVISTPERDAVRGKSDYGPPENTAHYREWNKEEFKNYVSQWFTISEHHVFDDKSIAQAIVCVKR